jgi:hypothetical protein
MGDHHIQHRSLRQAAMALNTQTKPILIVADFALDEFGSGVAKRISCFALDRGWKWVTGRVWRST